MDRDIDILTYNKTLKLISENYEYILYFLFVFVNSFIIFYNKHILHPLQKIQ